MPIATISTIYKATPINTMVAVLNALTSFAGGGERFAD